MKQKGNRKRMKIYDCERRGKYTKQKRRKKREKKKEKKMKKKR